MTGRFINELIKLLGATLEKKGRIWLIPISWIKGVAKLEDVLQLLLNSERLQKLTENYVVSNQKIVKAKVNRCQCLLRKD